MSHSSWIWPIYAKSISFEKESSSPSERSAVCGTPAQLIGAVAAARALWRLRRRLARRLEFAPLGVVSFRVVGFLPAMFSTNRSRTPAQHLLQLWAKIPRQDKI